jgi:hypothetical protein
MRIYTSYYSRLADLQAATILPVRISIGAPRFVKSGVLIPYLNFAPRKEMLKMNEKDYRQEFAKILSNLDFDKVIADLSKIANGRDIALLCFEKEGDFCHRHLVAEWLTKNGFEVKEWQKQKKEQLCLF